MIGYIYITINLINKKVYVGQKLSNKYVPTYYGSGRILKRSIEKYGKENFVNVMLDVANTKEELNEKEIYYITFYKEKYKENCYNIAKGAVGGNTIKYMSNEQKQNFITKITKINRERCSTDEYKQLRTIQNKKRYESQENREKQRIVCTKAWSDENLRKKQSETLKKYFSENKKNSDYLNQKCVFELNGEKIIFNSVKELSNFLKEKYDYVPDRRKFLNMMKTKKPFIPFHKNNEKLQKLKGMVIYKLNESVETRCDECSTVG